MKKAVSVILAAALMISATACGNSAAKEESIKASLEASIQASIGEAEQAETNSVLPDEEVKNNDNIITSTRWVCLDPASTMKLNEDGSLEWDSNKGTWTQEGETITLKTFATQSCGEYVMYADIISENDTIILKTQKVGMYNGTELNFSSMTYYPEGVKEEASRKVGDTVSTDIMEVTIKKAALGYYATFPKAADNGKGVITNIDEACEPADKGFYESSKGRCLLCIDFILKNTDRASFNTGDYILSFTVAQNGKSAHVRSYDPNNKDGNIGLNLTHMPIANIGYSFTACPTTNIIMNAGECVEIKYVGVVGFEPDDLSSPFDVIVKMKNSNDEEESFIFTIE